MKNKKRNKKYLNKIATKANNHTSIRVLYKKVGELPEAKIINDVYKLKRAIIKRKLNIIPYEKVYIICNNKKLSNNLEPNVYLL